MKVIIAGSRDCNDYRLVVDAVARSGFDVSEVVSGACRGVDLLGERWAQENGKPVKRFPAEWKRHGKSAGPKRNRQMAQYADALIALRNYESRGTQNMIEEAIEHGLSVFVYHLDLLCSSTGLMSIPASSCSCKACERKTRRDLIDAVFADVFEGGARKHV